MSTKHILLSLLTIIHISRNKICIYIDTYILFLRRLATGQNNFVSILIGSGEKKRVKSVT